MGSSYKYFIIGLLIAFFAIVNTANVYGQEVRITEEEIKKEQAFIEALIKKMDGDVEGALRDLEEIASSDRKNHAVLYEIAKIQMKLEKEEEAIQTINRALKLDGENLWYLGFKADLQELMGNYTGANESFATMIAIEPFNSDPYFRKTDNHLRIGKASDAIQTLDKLLERVGSTEEIHQRRFDIFRNMGDFERATIELEALAGLFPENTEYLFMLASQYSHVGRKRESDSLYSLILDIDPSDSKAQLALRSQQKGSTDDVDYILGLQNLFENSRADLDPKIIELIPFVERLSETQDPKLGEALLTVVSTLETTHKNEAKIFALMADIQQLSGKRDDAITSYYKAIELEKGVYSVWEQLMYLLYEKGDFEALYELTEDALDVYPNQIKIWLFNAKALRGMKKNNEALNSLEQAGFMAFDQNLIQQEILSTKAAIQYDMGMIDKSMKTFHEALSILPDNNIVLARMSLYMAMNDRDIPEAEALIKKNIESFPNSPVLTGTHALIQLKQGDRDKALETLQKLEDRQIEDSRIQALRERIESGADTKAVFDFWRILLEGDPL